MRDNDFLIGYVNFYVRSILILSSLCKRIVYN
jgi:hypothetical protein